MGSRSKSVAVNAGRVHHKIYLWCQRNIRVVKNTVWKKSARFCKRCFEKNKIKSFLAILANLKIFTEQKRPSQRKCVSHPRGFWKANSEN